MSGHDAAPLAWQMRPRTLEEFVGQTHLVGPGGPSRRALEANRLVSLILFGPPGCGKTALAHLIANRLQAVFVELNAVTAGVAEIRKVIAGATTGAAAQNPTLVPARRTLLFIDEIHRFSKVQQSALLPEVEKGTLTLIGVSTENPFFALVPALSSRSLLFELKPLEPAEIRQILERALTDAERGLGRERIRVAEEALGHLITQAEGDARRALTALEVAVLTTPPEADGTRQITLAVVEQAVQQKAIVYDDGDQRYDTISAFIKSMRGSDPDATVYWLAKMLEAGEDPRYIARRVIICAAEDVGNADPQALSVAVAALQAVETVGLPEGRIPLAQAALYVASAPKSNAVILAIDEAAEAVREQRVLPVPEHLKDTHYQGAKRLGRGQGYVYPHDAPGHHVPQAYLPETRRFYRPTDQGDEAEIKARLDRWRRKDTG